MRYESAERVNRGGPMRILRFLAAACPAVLASSVALAQEPATAAATGVREHDGFYLRLGLGLGFAVGKNTPDEGSAELDLSGFGIPSEIAAGGTLAPGMVIGGGAYSIFLPSPSYSAGEAEASGGATQLIGLGPFIDYYLDPRGGIHFGGALFLASGFVAEKEQDGGGTAAKASGLGFGAALMGGYEIFVGEQWSVGVVGRLAYYNVKLKADSPSNPKSSLSAFTPAVLFGATYH